MARARSESSEGFGTDSFLDIVCNMVGIIILLVLVMGMRVKEGPMSLAAETLPPAAADSESIEPEPEGPAVSAPPAAESPLTDVHAIEAQLGQGRAALARADQDRRTLEQRLQAARQAAAARDEELKQLRDQLAHADQWQTEMQKEFLAKQDQLRLLASAVQAVPGAKPAKSVQLEAYPAPFIKQVEGKEAHFRILAGRVVYVPFDELMEKAAPDAIGKMRLAPGSTEIESVVGPIHGFKVSYVFRRRNGALEDYWFTFVPLSDRMGETVAEALAPSSEFRRILASKDPRSTTVTFWAYQDSFDAFRQLRKEVYVLGYSVANWPMKLGDLIRAGRHGKHSESQ